ncbi:type II toxin-antitoxin system RelB/DinJ family antitoxin [Parafannyhessea umbonata]|uniref:type II toxin-antitoxin system RelB/DinJ family antitoxin n=1 Tax=Parafannyhessea umbonata TaxID=604330 RepID=UPI00359CA112
MEKTATLNLRVNPQVKKQAEAILDQLGIPMSTAVTMYLRQIALTGGIPFALTVPAAPRSVDPSAMTDDELSRLLKNRLDEAESGTGVSVQQARAELLG